MHLKRSNMRPLRSGAVTVLGVNCAVACQSLSKMIEAVTETWSTIKKCDKVSASKEKKSQSVIHWQLMELLRASIMSRKQIRKSNLFPRNSIMIETYETSYDQGSPACSHRVIRTPPPRETSHQVVFISLDS
ncbi:hypothetical protein AVEN_160790-1 [Araneus ventricosus]|uniref:Uncharacterized protein n=1 Tax=Araneus ventricosus TaxID=182803 RepID=A0A4Y2QEV7_ARAVE|nr:hypothetical protein AVEN_160790-1 [Araneus ventricosus]